MKKENTFLLVIFFIFIIFASYIVVSQAAGRFTIGNEDPYVVANTFAVRETDGLTWDSITFDTHEFDTPIRFNVKDNNPDNLNVRLCIGTNPNPSGVAVGEDCNVVNFNFPIVSPGSHAGSQGAQLVYTYNVDPSGTLEGIPQVIDLLQSDCTNNFCTKTFYADIIVDDGSGGITTDANSFSIFDNLPIFSNIYLSKSPINLASDSCEDFLPSQNCIINPTQGDYTSVNAQLSITDADADCSTSLPSGTLVICLVDSATEICDEATNNYRTYPLSYLSESGANCELSASIPVSDPQGIEFFVAPSNTAVPSGAYKSYVIASTDGRKSDIFSTDHQWEYGSLIAPDYPVSIDLGDPTTSGGDGIQLGEWNPGTSLATLTNHGNILLNLNWDATDASIGGTESCVANTATCWDITTTPDLIIDDDNACLTSSDPVRCLDTIETSIAESILPESDGGITTINFQPLGGVDICDALACDNISLTETFDTHYHIKPPIGLSAGTYETTIKFYTS